MTPARSAAARISIRLAAAHLAAVEAEQQSLDARIAADDAAYKVAPGDVKALALAAGKAEVTAALAGAREKLARAEAAGQPVAQLTPLRKQVEAAEKALATPTATYSPLSATYPTRSTGRRKALAEWITSRDNPLTARVAVNHIWMRHFGRPLVETVFDFGRNGKAPTHPELLDWLAVELMDNGWHMKPLHRLIVTSATYRAASGAGGASELARDPDNRWLWHFPARRLEAEAVRDAVLFTAGELDLTRGGLEIEVVREPESKRRSLYFATHPEQGGHSDFRALFDAPDPSECYRRTESLLPQQALALTNGPMTVHCSRVLARRLTGTAGADEAAWLTAAFEQVLGRPPTAEERKAAAGFLKKQAELLRTAPKEANPRDPAERARESLIRVLFAHNDFVTVR
jgi:hypothetical protein